LWWSSRSEVKLVKALGILFVVSLYATVLKAFPSNTRYGYASCQSCHLSPTGGGVLTAYGRMSAEEFLSTWSSEGESRFLHAFNTPKAILIGGDIRRIGYTASGKEGNQSDSFLMQADLELALRLTPSLFVVPSAGVYGKEQKTESRRHYILLNLSDNMSFRVGKFFPAYGIMFPDHTLITRDGMGFDEGRESYNVEISAKGDAGELFITGVLGQKGILRETSTEEVASTEVPKGFIVRSAAYLAKRSQLGISGFYLSTGNSYSMAFGTYGLFGITRDVYLLFEGDKKYISKNSDLSDYKETTLGLAQLGYEIFKGMHVVGTAEYQNEDSSASKISGGLQWYPRPHFEASFTLSRQTVAYENTDSSVLLLHYYF